MEDIRGSVAALITTFTHQMAAFEGKLQNQSDAPATTASLATEFASFKSFVMIALKALQEQIQMTAQAVDRLEMRNRRKILLIHGVAEENKEVTASAVTMVVTSQLKHAEFSDNDISRCHRMGRSSSNRPRPILVKLRDVSLRDKLWYSKTNLRDSGITISEFLTKARHEVFMQARQRFGVSKCWTREGYVFVAGPDDTRLRVSCLADLDKIVSQETAEQSSSARQKPAGAAAAAAASVAGKEPTAPRQKRAATSKK